MPDPSLAASVADVSVIIPAWNASATITRALHSVMAQDSHPAEIIVVDDGSTDETAAVAGSITALHPKGTLRVLRCLHEGAGAARNAGLQVATQRYVAFLDADDEWAPTKISRSLFHLRQNDLLLVSHDYVLVQGGREGIADCHRHFRGSADPYVTLFRRNYIATSTVVAQRCTLLEIGGFDAGLPAAQDYDLWLRLLARPHARFTVFDEALTRYYESDAGIGSDVERRRRCSLSVLHRNAFSLRARTGRAVVSFWIRCLVVHYEAVMGHAVRQEWSMAVGALLKFIPAMVAATFAGRTPGTPIVEVSRQ